MIFGLGGHEWSGQRSGLSGPPTMSLENRRTTNTVYGTTKTDAEVGWFVEGGDSTNLIEKAIN